MDYLLKDRILCGASEILDTVTQQPVDLDFTLPDYCADIEKILKCSLVTKIYSRNLSAGQLRVDGASIVRVLYCDSNKKALRCCEQTVPFSATIPVTGEAAEYIILTSAKTEYLNCRALTPRRLTVHGAFSLYTSVIEKSVYELKTGCDAEALQIKTESGAACEVCEFTQEQFNVSESVGLNPKSSVESIVRSEVSARLVDFQQSADKLILKGEITLRMLYICDAATGEVDQFVYVFPFIQSLGSKDGECSVTDIRLDVLSFELLLRNGMVTDEPAVNIEVKLCASVMGYKPTDITYISDAYSVSERTELSLDTLTLCSDIMPLNVSCAVKSNLPLGERPVGKILDIFCESPAVSAEIGDKVLSFSGKVNVCILAQTEEGELECIERKVDVTCSEVLKQDYAKAKNPAASVTSVSYRIDDNNSIEIRLDMHLSAIVSSDITLDQVTSVESSGEKPFSGKHALTLYYARSNEKIWDIAKRYSTPISTLCEENSITEEELSAPRMLLILNV